MGWDWGKGVAWRNVRVLTSLKRGHWFRQHRQVNDFLSKSKRNKLKNWVSEQTWSGVGSVETCKLSFPEEGGRGVGREELWSLAFLKKSIRRHVFQRYERPQTKMHTSGSILELFVFHVTTLQSKGNAKLSKQRIWHFYENGLIKTIQTPPHNLYVSVKLISLYCVLRLILVYPNPH